MLQTKPKIVVAKSFRLFYFDILNTKLESDDSADSDTDVTVFTVFQNIYYTKINTSLLSHVFLYAQFTK